MRSLFLTAAYLAKDTWKRWFEQPGGVLARVLVTAIMVGILTLILVFHEVQMASLERRLGEFGLSRLFVSETLRGQDLEAGRRAFPLTEFASEAEIFSVKVIPQQAVQGTRRFKVMLYSPSALAHLVDHAVEQKSALVLDPSLPPGIPVDLVFEERPLFAVSMAVPPLVNSLLEDEAVLFLPEEDHHRLLELGFRHLGVLEKRAGGMSLAALTDTLRQRADLDQSSRLTVRSAADWLSRIEELKAGQKTARIALVLIIGLALALIFGVLAMLEYREKVYVCALMTSLGAPRWLLGLRAFLETAVVANGAGLATLAVILEHLDDILAVFKMKSFTGLAELQTALAEDGFVLTVICLNLGVILSSLPVFAALRKPVGKVLQ